MNFGEWQRREPKEAARELRRRLETFLPEAQRRAAVASLVPDDAVEAEFAAAPAGGPLRGIPCMIKDMYDVRGLPTLGGSSFLKEVRPAPERESRIVRDLRAAGAVIAGKSHLFEFAWGLTGENAHYGDCEHPRFPGRTSGGSSSGSAVLVAAGIVPLAIGSDTGGSIRVPASFCGLYGYRGVPHDPRIADAVALAPSFDTVGWLAANPGDLLAATEALVGLAPSGSAPRGVYLEMPDLDPDVALACREAARVLVPPAEASLRDELIVKFAPAAETYGVIAGLESWKLHKKWADRYRARYGPLLQDRLERSRTISPAQLAAVEPSRASILAAWSAFFSTHDFLVMAAAPFEALAKDACVHANRLRLLNLTAPVSLAGLPALTIPVPLPSGLSAGLQVIANDPKSAVFRWALEAFAQSSD